VLLASIPAAAQLRVADWNVSFYTGSGRVAEFQTAIYGSFQGRTMAPDILICQEFTNVGAVTAFLTILNTAPGSLGDWAAAPFIDGPDTDSAFFFRTSKVEYLGTTLVVPGGNPSGAPRNVLRYDIRPFGYSTEATTLACYSVHMKAGASSSDQNRRLAEAIAIRADSNALPPGWNFLLAGDTNIQNSVQAAYQQFVGSQADNRGRFFDPINSPGSWNQNILFRFIHTQAPGTRGVGMDDRFDVILLSDSLVDGPDFNYIGNPLVPYSTTTWNDPNHSFRVWGNDGSSYRQTLTIAGNTMVGAVIAQALVDTAEVDSSGGHLPVFLDLRVPARVGAPASLNLGEVVQGSFAAGSLPVFNAGDVPRWSEAGIAVLTYSLSGTAGLGVPSGNFTAAPGAAPNAHTIQIDTSQPGPFQGTVLIASSSAEDPVHAVAIMATILPPACWANCDGSAALPVLNILDFNCFLNKFAAADPYANCDGSTTAPVLNVLDFNCFLNKFAAGCP
jgi:hypothetical protein